MAIKRVLLRRDTAANWTINNPTLLQWELWIEFDTKKLKIWNWINTWTTLEYLSLSVNINDPDLIEKIEDTIWTKIVAWINTSVVYDDTTWITTINAIWDVVKADNLSWLANYTTARTNLWLWNVDNTTDANKPISTSVQTALDNKANQSTTYTKTETNTLLDLKLDDSQKGVANWLAELWSDWKIPSAQLPSYVDDILEYTNLAWFPWTWESWKIYVSLDTNITYRWSWTVYIEISSSLALWETSSTAYRWDRWKTAYDHTSLVNNPHSVTKTQVWLWNVDNTSDVSKPISTLTQTALDWKVDENANITWATKTKITYDSKWLVTAWSDLVEADIPNLSISKTTWLQTVLDWKVVKVTSTDNAITRFDGTTWVVQNSSVIIDDDGKVWIWISPIKTLDVSYSYNWPWFGIKNTNNGSNWYSEWIMENDVWHWLVWWSIWSWYTQEDLAWSTYLYNDWAWRKMYIKSQDELCFFTWWTSLVNKKMTIATNWSTTINWEWVSLTLKKTNNAPSLKFQWATDWTILEWKDTWLDVYVGGVKSCEIQKTKLISWDWSWDAQLQLNAATTWYPYILFTQWTTNTFEIWKVSNNWNFYFSNNTQQWEADSALLIHPNSTISMPKQPIISGQMWTSILNPDSPQVLLFNDFWVNQWGITYDAWKFTVPVAWVYRITLNPFFRNGSNASRVYIWKNTTWDPWNSHIWHSYRENATYDTWCLNSVVNLSANDYITFYLSQWWLYNQSGDTFNQFTIQKIA